MAGKNLFLRMVEPKDEELLFRWANDETVRKNAFHTQKISYEEHREWFKNLLADKRQMQFIMFLVDEPIGQVRLIVSNGEAEIDYSIASTKRGLGYGKELIRLTLEIVHKEYPFIKKLMAKVKQANTASIDCFEKNGFNGIYCQYEYEMEKFQLIENANL